jgi:hypothetical protein
VVEELFSGYRCKLSASPDSVSLFVSKKRCNGHSLGKELVNNFLHIRDLPVFKKLGYCELDCIAVSNQKADLESIFDIGPLGAERLNDSLGGIKIVLLDIMRFKGVDIKDEPWKARRIYLEDAHKKLGSTNVLLSESVSLCKRDFFETLSALGSKGIVFKNIESVYRGGLGRDFLEARSSLQTGFENASLREGFSFCPVVSGHGAGQGFDFDTYLAMQALDSPENVQKLLDS